MYGLYVMFIITVIINKHTTSRPEDRISSYKKKQENILNIKQFTDEDK